MSNRGEASLVPSALSEESEREGEREREDEVWPPLTAFVVAPVSQTLTKESWWWLPRRWMEALKELRTGLQSVFLVPAACGNISENCWIPSLPLNGWY